MIWSKEETLPRAEIEKIQLERLKESVAYIYEKAGGATTNGVNSSLLDIKIEQTHQTTPCYFGSKFEIDRVRNG